MFMLFRKVHVFFWIIYLANTFLATTLKAQVNGNQDVTYISPAQGSYLNHPSTDILIRYSKPIQQNTLSFSVSASGKQIQVTYTLLNDEKTVLIHPLNILPTNVSINVSSKDGLLFSGGETIQKLQFSFYTTSKISHQLIDNENPVLGNKKNIETFYGISDNTLLNKISNQIHLNVTANNNKSNGYYFISTIQNYADQNNSCMILDSTGKIIFYRITPHYAMDFKKLTDSTFSYFNYADNTFRILDTHFNEIDTIKAGNGYITDTHDLQFDKRTGHYFLLAQQNVTINMADSISGGDSNAQVLGIIIQEIDERKKVVFEWKTLDYLPIISAIGQDLKSNTIDYTHCNAIDIESDTSILLCSRHLNEIERIDRRTGALIWRLGLHSLNNDFTFINDTIGFSYQHDIRRLPNGHITLFDNGNFRSGTELYSRAVEYELDELHKTAKLVWQYRNTPDDFAGIFGNVQRLPNGGTLIGWGGTTTVFTEIDSNNNKVLEVKMPKGISYRAYRFDIPQIIQPNQLPLKKTDTLTFWNKDSSYIYNNLNSYVLPQDEEKVFTYQINRLGNNVNIYTKTDNDFYQTSSCNLNFDYTSILQKDTLICKGAIINLNIQGDSNNTTYHWSTSDTTASIKVAPTASTIYWVDMTSWNFTKRDSINIQVSSVPDFTIKGNSKFSIPYQIDSFWVPNNGNYSYEWGIGTATLLSGFGTNKIHVQMDSTNSTAISSTITNQYSCTNSSSLIIEYVESTGLKEIIDKSTFRVYPNPTNQNIEVDGQSGFIYTLYDMNGKMLIQSKSTSNSHELIDLAKLNSGIYFLFIISGDRTEKYKVEKL